MKRKENPKLQALHNLDKGNLTFALKSFHLLQDNAFPLSLKLNNVSCSLKKKNHITVNHDKMCTAKGVDKEIC